MVKAPAAAAFAPVAAVVEVVVAEAVMLAGVAMTAAQRHRAQVVAVVTAAARQRDRAQAVAGRPRALRLAMAMHRKALVRPHLRPVRPAPGQSRGATVVRRSPRARPDPSAEW